MQSIYIHLIYGCRNLRKPSPSITCVLRTHATSDFPGKDETEQDMKRLRPSFFQLLFDSLPEQNGQSYGCSLAFFQSIFLHLYPDQIRSHVNVVLGSGDIRLYECPRKHGLASHSRTFESAFALQNGRFAIECIGRSCVSVPFCPAVCIRFLEMRVQMRRPISRRRRSVRAPSRGLTMWAVDDGEADKVTLMFKALG